VRRIRDHTKSLDELAERRRLVPQLDDPPFESWSSVATA
jgi:hypothetical protein